MKKAVFVLAVITAIVIWQGVSFYSEVTSANAGLEQKAAAKAKELFHIKTISKVSFYHGSNSYQVVQGKNEQEEEIIAWISTNPKIEPFSRKASAGVTKKQVKELIDKKVDYKKIIDIRLGAENKVPLWEVTYIDQEDRYSFYYVAFKDGAYLNKKYNLKRETH
ncbi:DUF5590 domain-containing protein [Bacillus taeanensis]|uniref:Copper amine oxidase n=1 Tax=Bacillus taeanensis TaxID=273032 RepID=A0A366XW94_9BACI|nr:DUF5590 domain-containing protein [Bacillus taeanensis]RBW69425.1 copper amine oxidase [Bacillus taeanensis]